jgi:16S rRNA (cytosine1402-N4)-methyltransferase
VPAPAAAPQFRLLTRGAERPDSEEVTGNPRAASARLRAAERTRQAA